LHPLCQTTRTRYQEFAHRHASSKRPTAHRGRRRHQPNARGTSARLCNVVLLRWNWPAIRRGQQVGRDAHRVVPSSVPNATVTACQPGGMPKSVPPTSCYHDNYVVSPGDSTATPSAAKCRVFRVTITRSCARAIPAIVASARPGSCPAQIALASS